MDVKGLIVIFGGALSLLSAYAGLWPTRCIALKMLPTRAFARELCLRHHSVNNFFGWFDALFVSVSGQKTANSIHIRRRPSPPS